MDAFHDLDHESRQVVLEESVLHRRGGNTHGLSPSTFTTRPSIIPAHPLQPLLVPRPHITILGLDNDEGHSTLLGGSVLGLLGIACHAFGYRARATLAYLVWATDTACKFSSSSTETAATCDTCRRACWRLFVVFVARSAKGFSTSPTVTCPVNL